MARFRLFTRHAALPWSLVGVLILSLVLISVTSGTAQKTPKNPMTVRELLSQYSGYDSNLGKIKRLGNDFLLVQEENAQTVVPFTSIQEVRLVKENSTEPVKIEIRLVSKD